MMDGDEVTDGEELAAIELKAAQRLFAFWASDNYWRLSNKFYSKQGKQSKGQSDENKKH